MPKSLPSTNNNRLKIVKSTIVIFFLVILSRLFFWQVVASSTIRTQNLSQTSKLQNILPNTGKVLSSDNFPLSMGIRVYTLSVYKPNLKISLDDLISKIQLVKPDLISGNPSVINNLRQDKIKWATFSGYINQNQKDQLSIPGLEFQATNTRYYPEGGLAKNLVTNIETFYRRTINGKTGFALSSIDGTGQGILTKRNWQQPEVDGGNIKTSINRQVQIILDNELKNGLKKYQAQSASGVIIHPSTGEIIAMSYISSDTSPNTNLVNINSLFEPGSIFKPIVVAIGLETNKIGFDHICKDCDRPRVFGQYTINNWDNQTHPNSDLKEIIKNSDNIGMSGIISQIGLDNFKNYFHKLGLDSKSDVDLIGESISPPKKYYSNIDLATASFGQGFAVNELQMIQAFNTIANDGIEVIGHVNSEYHPKSINVFSKDTANKVVAILKYAVENGAVKNLKPKNLEVCAKSGTAQISVEGQYNDQNTIGSYIGFSPCQRPKFTMLIIINQPKIGEWGSSTAAPIWYEIAQKITPLL